jgi:hypothetical protein
MASLELDGNVDGRRKLQQRPYRELMLLLQGGKSAGVRNRNAVSVSCCQMHLTRGSGQIHEVVKWNPAADSARIFTADDMLPCQKLCCGQGKIEVSAECQFCSEVIS